MTMPLLATKLYRPPVQPNTVLRPRLIAQLNEGLRRRLTLISAPAGFGKTTMVSAWVEGSERPTAWLSLDEGDHDPFRFLTYLVAALRTIDSTVGDDVLRGLQSSQPPPVEAMLIDLLNDLATLRDPFTLILDDYHVIDAQPVDAALTYLIEHLPPQALIVMTTREDPHLPLARLRARDQLTELRAPDLRFTLPEATTFLTQVMGLTLSDADIASLESRTEGWIAGLQLAALSLRGHKDTTQFIRAFAGNHRYIVDYLVEEVLQRQPDSVRRFLLQTAILDRLNGSLCDAVSGQDGSAALLEALERGNFFVVPLDDTRQWYRYHHLFADVLRARLLAEQPEQTPMLHQRASEWYEHHGFAIDAIRHAMAAKDYTRAADLIEVNVPSMHRDKQEATLLNWLDALPDEIVRFRPALSVGYAWAFLASGDLAAADARLRDAERWMAMEPEAARANGMVVANDEAFRRLPATIAVYRAAHAQAVGDVHGAVTYARRALDLVPEDDHLGRGAATALLGLASWTSGDLEVAYRTFADGIANVQRAGNLADAVGGAIALADISIAQGRLREAMHIYERALRLATERGEPFLRGTADVYVGMSELYREHDDLQTARQQLLNAKELGEHNGVPQNRYRWYVATARILEAQGDLDGALDLLHKAQHLYIRDFFPTARPVEALIARVWIAQGKWREARDWAREQGLSVEDDLSYLREYEHITLARALLAGYEHDGEDSAVHGAKGLLERLLRAAESGKRTGSVIELLMLLAYGHQEKGDIPAALIPLERGLTLAEPEGYVRMFVDEGPAMAQLLHEAAARGIMPAYVDKLLLAFDAKRQSSPEKLPPTTVSDTAFVAQALSEPLTQREREVLRLLKTELSGPEIATELVVALSTVHSHIKRIYNKLNVTNRRAAVKRAAELHLL